MPNNRKIEFPSLETDRLNLRILTLHDAEEVWKHFSDEEVTRFMDIEPCKDIKEAEEIIRFHLEDSGCRWGLFDKDKNNLIGTCGYHCLRRADDHFIAEVGFDLSKLYWGKGLMYEGMKGIIDFGFRELGLTMIDATAEPENKRSINLMSKLGFQREVERKDHLISFNLNRKSLRGPENG
ncbi:N-acetyltransferase [Paenibacillus baekrokdamisoli]|uniref:N-acetyltransferase n=1 Tax=Paenibacillus baekrokdamisoli TaxID=1712516 RepID=A0A3G9JHG4_9BACL|nr:GNAT family N-acetyltransferase [Paenibacillus baekrokdamisoli]MBB3072855.1 ribosomal-protein-alanine N-acetyltransferase [Paenibacillus baekrokdamisoli]BBH24413.1 N-acetyltransferase [Paenibacillus baekrokdamisoli]